MSNPVNDTPTAQEMTSAATPVLFPTSLCGSGSSMYNEINEVDNGSGGRVIPNIQSEIKIEPPEDINDVPENTSNYNESASDYYDSPKIRLTPTIKLMPTSNPADPKRRFTCPYDNCTKSYGKSSHLRSHLTWHTGIKPFVCTELNCGKGFTRSDELNRHVRTHTGEKPFECIQCTKKFSRSDHLTKHLATHAKQMQNKSEGPKKSCKEVDINHVKKACYLNHSLDSKNIKGEVLSYANKECYFNDALRSNSNQEEDVSYAKKERYFNNAKYSKTSHGEDETHAKKSYLNGSLDPKTSSEGDVSPNDIEQCNYSSGMHFMASITENCRKPDSIESPQEKIEEATTGQYFNHSPIKIKLERPGNSDEYHVVPPHTSARKDFSAAMIESRQSVSNTIKQEDITLDRSSHVVPADGAFMGWPEIGKKGTAYDSHRPWRCTLCEKLFKRQDDLNRHLRTHTGEKPFSCVACNRRFMRSDHLKKHLKTHTNSR